MTVVYFIVTLSIDKFVLMKEDISIISEVFSSIVFALIFYFFQDIKK